MIGTILCIMSVLPLFLAMCLSGSDLMYIGAVCLLLGFVALACLAFVYAGTQTAAMEKLLEEGDYTRQRKSKSRLIGTVSVCYWLVVTAIFMFYTFGPYGNAQAKYRLVHLGDRGYPVRRRNGRSPSGRTGRKKEIKST